MESILSQIDAEIDRLQQVRKLLVSGGVGAPSPARGGKKKSTASTPAKRTRVLSPEARKRIADAQKRRWAAQRKAKKES